MGFFWTFASEKDVWFSFHLKKEGYSIKVLNPLLPFLKKQTRCFRFSKYTAETFNFCPMIIVREQHWVHVHSVRKDEVTAVQARHKLASSEDGKQSRVLVRGYIESSEKAKLLGWPRICPGEKVRGCRSWSQILETKLQHRSTVHRGNRIEDWHTNTTAQVGTEGLCLSLMRTPGPLGRRYERRSQVRLLREWLLGHLGSREVLPGV